MIVDKSKNNLTTKKPKDENLLENIRKYRQKFKFKVKT